MELNEHSVEAVFAYLTRACPDLPRLFAGLDLKLTARMAAGDLGVGDSAALARWLRAQDLPQYNLLRNWWYVVEMHRRAQAGETLYALAANQGRELATLSRFVARVTGEPWSL